MQDIDDFDPLDDILLSDEEPPDPKSNLKNKSFIFQKPKESLTTDDESKEDKKKRMLAELFGTKEEPKEELQMAEEVTVPPTKSDWLDLKTDPKSNVIENSPKSVTWQTPEVKSFEFPHNPLKMNNFEEKSSAYERDDLFDTSHQTILRTSDPPDRRRSESSAQSEMKKSKQRFKSLDLDLDFDFDKVDETGTPKNQNVAKNAMKIQSSDSLSETKSRQVKTAGEAAPRNNSRETKPDVTELFYVPSVGNRRPGTSKGRSQIFEEAASSSFLGPDYSQNVSDAAKESLPTWLDPKIQDVRSSTAPPRMDKSDIEHLGKSDTPVIKTKNTTDTKNIFSSEKKTIEIPDNVDNNVLTTVLELKKKQEELKNIAKAQTDNLIHHEQEIQNSAIKLIQQHRNNISTLLQIVSSENINGETNEKSDDQEEIRSKIKNCENTISQLQMKLIQYELEKSELRMKLEYVEKKYSADVESLEDLYSYKLQVAKDKENLLKIEIQNIEQEYNLKLQRKKENEDEIIQSYKEKIKTMQEEHLKEVKYISDYQAAKLSTEESKIGVINDNISNEKLVSKELTVKEIALEKRQKELLELEEELNKRNLILEGKSVELKIKDEELETKTAKEKLALEQQKKDLKLSQMIFEEKEISWEKEKQRDKEYLSTWKQELENMQENLLKDEKKLIKQKFELSSEKARLETIMNLNGTFGHLDNILQNKAELQGTLEEVNRLKDKLLSEREDIKKEERRLKEESWKLKEIKQQLILKNKHHQKLLDDSEIKREEGIQALKRAQRIESQMNERMNEIENRLSNLKRKEEQLIHEKIEISKERDIINKRKYQLDLVLPELTYEDQLPFNIMNRSIIDPKIMIMKLKTENDMDSLFGH